MPETILNAGAGSVISENFGGNGRDDLITLNILDDFTGAISIATGQVDGEIETLTINLPDGWQTVSVSDVTLPGETPPLRVFNATIVDDQGGPRGTLSVLANVIEFNVACFARGTRIMTCRGYVPVEELEPGDRVLTLDCGYQPVRWIGSKALDAIDLRQHPKLKPILIRAGAIGPGFPSEDLCVSPQHRVLVRSAIAQRIFGEAEVLVPAKKLLPLDGVETDHAATEVEYFHIMFDTHQLVHSNGCLTESLFLGQEALKAMAPGARAELETLFPEIQEDDFVPLAARLIPALGKQVNKLVERHCSNAKPLFG